MPKTSRSAAGLALFLGGVGCSIITPLDFVGGIDAGTGQESGGSSAGTAGSQGGGGTGAEAGADDGAVGGGGSSGGADAGRGGTGGGGTGAEGGADDGAVGGGGSTGGADAGRGGTGGGSGGSSGSGGGSGGTGGTGGSGGKGGSGGSGGSGGKGGSGGSGAGAAGMSGAGSGGASGAGAAGSAGGGGCAGANLTSDPLHCGACGTTCDSDQFCIQGACVSSPCDGLCATHTTISLSGDGFRMDNIGTTEQCFEVVGYERTGNAPVLVCWNFDTGRTLAVNGQALSCAVEPGTLLPAQRAGGYCVTVGPGNFSYAGFKFPMP